MSPRLARVAGHTIVVYYQEEHQLPHVQIRGEHRFSLAIETGELLTSRPPPSKLLREIREWLDQHRKEAMTAWEAARRHEPIDRIEDDA